MWNKVAGASELMNILQKAGREEMGPLDVPDIESF